MASVGRPKGCDPDPPTWSDRAWGSLHIELTCTDVRGQRPQRFRVNVKALRCRNKDPTMHS